MEKDNIESWAEEFKKIGKEVTLQSHKTLVRYGEKATKLYLILKGGMVLLHVHPITGEERAINFFIPEFHPIATVSQSLVMGEPSKYHLKTFTNTKLIELNWKGVEAMMERTNISRQFQEYGVKTLLEKNELRALLIVLSSEEMLHYLHENYPHILRNVPSKYVANFLGITPQWLSKLKHKL
ncbi:Crp/Fnr family transcriptional regulator [Aureibacter tunicatorum]|uniref:CRP-like cAMP-binding protein n=1 Tax=Aureibacter tunicatorum TaxID=866807 RepID=A0AAE3XJZ5_9BACT|nr:hypothetical protein [Aureibacter tunicatorum]MDR6237181.1 hypothetical protein [Aureibacter tunicatorum]BDD06173.1 hypothetical protein AUTU_36560 [Aureibacter tunicatorum]